MRSYPPAGLHYFKTSRAVKRLLRVWRYGCKTVQAMSIQKSSNAQMSSPSRIGQRVRFLRHDHPNVPLGRGGMIDQLGLDNQFVVLTDCGGFFGWTSFDSWEATNEPDVVLNPEYVAMRTRALCDDSSIKPFPSPSKFDIR
jgi:hypothetical protein